MVQGVFTDTAKATLLGKWGREKSISFGSGEVLKIN